MVPQMYDLKLVNHIFKKCLYFKPQQTSAQVCTKNSSKNNETAKMTTFWRKSNLHKNTNFYIHILKPFISYLQRFYNKWIISQSILQKFYMSVNALTQIHMQHWQLECSGFFTPFQPRQIHIITIIGLTVRSISYWS